VTTQTDVELGARQKGYFDDLLLRYPALAVTVSRVLSQRLAQTSALLAQTPAVASEPAVVTAPAPAIWPGPKAAPVSKPRRVYRPSPLGRAFSVAIAGLQQDTRRFILWFDSRSPATKLRLASAGLLLVWLCGVSAPAAIINALSKADVDTGDLQRLAFIQTPTPTHTPTHTPTFTPTFTPTPTYTPVPATPVPTATSIPPTYTPVPTETPAPPTPTPIPPTATPIPPTATPAPPTATSTPEPPTATPTPSVQFRLVSARRLTPCENLGKHNIFVKVIDAAGNPIDGVTLVQAAADGSGIIETAVTGTKGPGQAEFIMWKGAQYVIYVSRGSDVATASYDAGISDLTAPLSSAFPDEAECTEPDKKGGNTLFHNSFEVIFQKLY